MNRLPEDIRYSWEREWCGQFEPRWIVRFCGDWVGKCVKQRRCQDIAREHMTNRAARIRTEHSQWMRARYAGQTPR